MRNVVLTELLIGFSDWANISDKVRLDPPITITRGRSDEDSQAGPTTGTLSINNKDGVFSPRNPLSPLHGKIGRNTRLRVSLGRGKYGLVIRGGSDGRLATPDSVPLSITGDIDVRVDLELLDDGDPSADWTWPGAGFDLMGKWSFFTGQIGWQLMVLSGTLWFFWSDDGTNVRQSTCTVPLAGPDKDRRAFRVTLDVDNGAGGRTITFYQAATLAGPWTQLGDPLVQGGVTSILDTPTETRIGAAPQSSAFTWGRSGPVVVYGAEIRDGINGTVVAAPDPTGAQIDPVPFASGAFTDAQGNVWTPSGTADAARIWYGDVDVRLYGEIASLPPRWDLSGRNRWVPITVSGLLRRLGQGDDPAPGGLRDWILSRFDALTTYFPLSGGEGTTYSINLGRTYTNSTRYRAVGFPLWKYGVSLGATWLGTGMELTATGRGNMQGDVGTGDDNFAFDFVFQSPHFGRLDTYVWSYDNDRWLFRLNTDDDAGTIQVTWFAADGDGTIVQPVTAVIPELQDGALHTCRFAVQTGAGDVQQYQVYIDGTLRDSGDNNKARPLHGTSLWQHIYGRTGDQAEVNLGHLTLWSHTDLGLIPDVADYVTAAGGYAGENAHERMTRIADVAGIPLTIVGDAAATTVMGPQYAEATLEQIRDAEEADRGILTETRGTFGLLYRTLASMYNQTPVATIDYAGRQLAEPFEATDDDQTTRNDVTASRRDGGSYRITQDTGPLATADPPTGVGPYKADVTVNVETDDQLPAMASWLLHLGTVDEARFPSIAVQLAADEVEADPDLTAGVLAADVGDHLVVTNAASQHIYNDVSAILLGYTETIGEFTHDFEFNAAPGSPYEVITLDDPASRIGAGDTSQLTAAVTSVDDTLTVLSADGETLWTTDPAEFPIPLMIGGEEMTATGITGTTPGAEQIITVVRAVNGVSKSHSAGEIVRLKRRAVWAL